MNTKSHDCEKHSLRRTATVRQPFLFTWSELPNVYIVGIQYDECGLCHKVSGIFPMPEKLLETLTKAVILKPSPLTGDEIRYLRKSVRKKASDFGQLVGVTSEQVSRWENGHNPPEKSADKLVRMIAANQIGAEKSDANAIANLIYKKPEKESYVLRFHRKQWAGACINHRAGH
jgi:DNA-binding transcriptional regulator YiaG